jgi:hypothetical protein
LTAKKLLRLLRFFHKLNYSHFPVLEEGVSLAVLPLKISFEMIKKMIDYKYSLEPFLPRTDSIWIEVLEIFAKTAQI